jgi:hypothetical protein
MVSTMHFALYEVFSVIYYNPMSQLAGIYPYGIRGIYTKESGLSKMGDRYCYV